MQKTPTAKEALKMSGSGLFNPLSDIETKKKPRKPKKSEMQRQARKPRTLWKPRQPKKLRAF